MLTKVKNIICYILYIFIIIYLLVFVPKIFGFHPLVVISPSMSPTFSVGSLIYYCEDDLEQLHSKDILVYRSKEHIISHRIVEKTNSGFITKGDANKDVDSSIVSKNQILGRAIPLSIPLLGFYADFVYQHKYVLGILIFILCIDLIIDFYKKRRA